MPLPCAASRAVQPHPHGGQFDFARPSARTPAPWGVRADERAKSRKHPPEKKITALFASRCVCVCLVAVCLGVSVPRARWLNTRSGVCRLAQAVADHVRLLRPCTAATGIRAGAPRVCTAVLRGMLFVTLFAGKFAVARLGREKRGRPSAGGRAGGDIVARCNIGVWAVSAGRGCGGLVV